MDMVGIGCTALRAPLAAPLMTAAAYFGHGAVGSAIIGIAAGLSVGHALIGPPLAVIRSRLSTLGLLLPAAIGIGVLIFFHAIERDIEASISVDQRTHHQRSRVVGLRHA